MTPQLIALIALLVVAVMLSIAVLYVALRRDKIRRDQQADPKFNPIDFDERELW